ncbi:hypothetical protein [Bifidobacterium criceti]|uniref:Actin n=1 Tax=Bifidobacterium criceti TaxID=1960969 RepID=A0A2A2EH60_9BIFI|nr:hypothetical protein [Bifidobacterium criceti]PAU68238.1 actin [Bifidobacterium criceti]
MTESNPATHRVPVARQSYQAPVAQTYATLLQTLRYSAGFDVVGNDDAARTVSFHLPNGGGTYEARVVESGEQSAVIIDAPLGANDSSGACSRLYRELAEQMAAQSTVVPSDVIAKRRFWRWVTADNNGPRSKWAIAAVVVACLGAIYGVSSFDEWSPNWSGALMFIILMFTVCGVAFAVTGRRGHVSGRNLVLIALAIACVATVLLLCASIVVQISHG